MTFQSSVSEYEWGIYCTYSHFRDNPEDLETFKSIQDYDPELHESESYYKHFPTRLKAMCTNIDEKSGTEPSGEDVWNFVQKVGIDVAIDLVDEAAQNYIAEEDIEEPVAKPKRPVF